MRYCDQKGIGFVIGGRESEAIFQIIQGIGHWERLRGGRENEVVRFYRQRGDAENVIQELKQWYAASHILSEDFLAKAVFFHLQLLATTWLESSSIPIWIAPGGGCGSNSCATGC